MRNALAFIAIVIVVLAGSYGTSKYTQRAFERHTALVCKRTEAVVNAVNRAVPALTEQRNILHNFAESAASARMSSYSRSHHRSDLAAAQAYHSDAAKLTAQVHFAPIPGVTC